MINEVALLAVSTFVSEDAACIAAGTLVASGRLPFAEAALGCFAGISAGDLGIFYAGRLLGASIHPWLSAGKLKRASKWLSGNTARTVLVSRFVPGSRTYTYFAAGVLGAPAGKFSVWFVVASAIWTPLLVGSAAILGSQIASSLLSFGGVMLVLLLIRQSAVYLSRWENRRRVFGWFRRKLRWEFWPVWAAYIPVVPVLLWFAWKHRSATVFTAANPGIHTGGLLEESKSNILRALDGSGAVSPWTAVRPGEPIDTERDYPVVCKPDAGERGRGVLIAHSAESMLEYLASAERVTILQDYVPGPEFGIFYYRYPHEEHGRIFSITAKRFPTVTGDGVRTLKQLILADPRAVAISHVYLAKHPDAATMIPALGEAIQLVDVGSHCRGTIFLDGNHLRTEALERRVDEIARSFDGFCFGRFDVRGESEAALKRGEFRILELNGVGSEATHIYDPRISVLGAYRVLWQQWRIAFEIGAANRARGRTPTSARALIRLFANRFRNLLRRHVDPLLSFRRSRRNVPV